MLQPATHEVGGLGWRGAGIRRKFKINPMHLQSSLKAIVGIIIAQWFVIGHGKNLCSKPARNCPRPNGCRKHSIANRPPRTLDSFMEFGHVER
jgi:hypothetical protein